jgi:redox-sensitive bicupin YhaK (pirin superfamily)
MTTETDKPAVLEVVELGMPWQGLDPFIFTVHHVDEYPEGNEHQGPAASLAGRRLGMDFSYRDGWSMYQGDTVPGFPQHPHRGFETVTVVRRGYVDHSDSLGATARYGGGDVQWLTTGGGIMHAEMFPLIHDDMDNPLELFQIWLNLPPHSKLVDAYFAMLWSEDIPVLEPGHGEKVEVVAGQIGDDRPPAPPPDSWASQAAEDFAIWVVLMDPGSSWVLPAAAPGLNRMLHVAQGGGVRVGGTRLGMRTGARLASDVGAELVNDGDAPVELLLLQGRPIGAPVIQMGPFVMNSADEIQTAIADYRRTQFGGWPWQSPSPVHARTKGRFARHVDGRIEERDLQPVN